MSGIRKRALRPTRLKPSTSEHYPHPCGFVAEISTRPVSGIGHHDDTPSPIALFYDMLDRPPPIGDGDFYGRNAQRTRIVEHVLVLETTCDSSIELSQSHRSCGQNTSALNRSGRSSIGSSMHDAAHSLILKDEITNGLLARLQRNTFETLRSLCLALPGKFV